MKRLLLAGLLVLSGATCGDPDEVTAACDEWQKEVRLAYIEAQGGTLSHINLISETDIAKSVPGRPEDCDIPSSDENTL